MQPIDGRELLGKIEGRAEVVDAAIDIARIGDVPGIVLPPEVGLPGARC